MTAAPASRLVLPVTFVIWVAYGILAGFGRWPLATLWIAVAEPGSSPGPDETGRLRGALSLASPCRRCRRP